MTDANAINPSPLPTTARPPAPRGKVGRLKVFLGMAPGVGKTAAMLRAAIADKLAGRDVVIALAQAHEVRAVEILAGRLPWMGRPPANILDVDEVVARRPDIVVVDELARANPTGSRHAHRFQDALELLEAGIDVYTTLNVYEMASRADLLWPAAGEASRPIVPDGILDKAEIVLVDMPPTELIQRLQHGQIRFPEGCGLEKSRLFEEDTLMALREMAARWFAERVAKDTQARRQALHAGGPAKEGQRVLVAVEAGWDSEQEALTRQIALALDRQRLSELSEKAKLVAESEKLGKTLLDSMSHEIRTPLAVIIAAAADLAELESVAAPGQALIAEIQEAAQRLNRLAGKVLDITRLESGHIAPLFSECEVYDIVHTAVAETEKDLARHLFSSDLAPGLPIIRTDFVFLQQAIMNLLTNAAIHTPPGTQIKLRVWRDRETLHLEVADRGAGLAPHSLPRVFDKFYRGPAAPTGGTGLGLSLVKGFVEALGGRVKAENRAGGGAEFTISLPLTETNARPPVSI